MSPAFLEELSRARPDPGGGAAAAYAAALGLALLEKVVKLEANRRPPGGNRDPFWGKLREKVERLGQSFTRLREDDVEAYRQLARARVSRDRPGLAAAVQEAVAVPRRIMEEATAALRLLARAGDRCRSHLVSDLLVAGELLEGALQGAWHIARANLPWMADAQERRAFHRRLSRSRRQGRELWDKVRQELERREPGPRPGRGA